MRGRNTTWKLPASLGKPPLFLLAVCLVVSSAVLANPARLALVIGNSNYSGGIFPGLERGPELDARAVAAHLKTLGFEVVNPRQPGEPVLNANIEQMRGALNGFADRLAAAPGAMAFVFYAGHGVSAKDDRMTPERSYLIPVGAPIEYENDAQHYALPLDKIVGDLKAVNVGLGVVVLDACRNTALKSRFRAGTTRGLTLPASNTSGVLVAFSTAAGSVAENRPGEVSVYTSTLLSHLGAPGVSLIDAFINIRRDVMQKTGQEPDAQLQITANPVLVPAALKAGPQLSVTSVPGGAEVFIDEVKVGTTPLTDGTLEVGQTVTIRVVLPGHVPVTQRVRMGSGNMPVHVPLARLPSPSVPPVVVQNPAQPVKPPEPVAEADPRVRRAVGELVSIPGGSFEMGCLTGENECQQEEEPAHTIKIRPFRLGRHEVTFDQWDAYADVPGGYRPADQGWGRGNRPVINVSWNDIQNFLNWLNANSAGGYRLPTESEWEYAARAGTKTKYGWGNDIGRGHANCDSCGSQWDLQKTAPVGAFAANRFGLFDMHGNVWEWTQDCFNRSYVDASRDGSPRLSGDCSSRILRGGSWSDPPIWMRSAARIYIEAGVRDYLLGFRLAQDVP